MCTEWKCKDWLEWKQLTGFIVSITLEWLYGNHANLSAVLHKPLKSQSSIKLPWMCLGVDLIYIYFQTRDYGVTGLCITPTHLKHLTCSNVCKQAVRSKSFPSKYISLFFCSPPKWGEGVISAGSEPCLPGSNGSCFDQHVNTAVRRERPLRICHPEWLSLWWPCWHFGKRKKKKSDLLKRVQKISKKFCLK